MTHRSEQSPGGSIGPEEAARRFAWVRASLAHGWAGEGSGPGIDEPRERLTGSHYELPPMWGDIEQDTEYRRATQ
jgi:hypothetical protein